MEHWAEKAHFEQGMNLLLEEKAFFPSTMEYLEHLEQMFACNDWYDFVVDFSHAIDIKNQNTIHVNKDILSDGQLFYYGALLGLRIANEYLDNSFLSQMQNTSIALQRHAFSLSERNLTNGLESVREESSLGLSASPEYRTMLEDWEQEINPERRLGNHLGLGFGFIKVATQQVIENPIEAGAVFDWEGQSEEHDNNDDEAEDREELEEELRDYKNQLFKERLAYRGYSLFQKLGVLAMGHGFFSYLIDNEQGKGLNWLVFGGGTAWFLGQAKIDSAVTALQIENDIYTTQGDIDDLED